MVTPHTSSTHVRNDSKGGLSTCHRSTRSMDPTLLGSALLSRAVPLLPPATPPAGSLSLSCTSGTAWLGFRAQSSWVWSARRHLEQNCPPPPNAKNVIEYSDWSSREKMLSPPHSPCLRPPLGLRIVFQQLRHVYKLSLSDPLLQSFPGDTDRASLMINGGGTGSCLLPAASPPWSVQISASGVWFPLFLRFL